MSQTPAPPFLRAVESEFDSHPGQAINRHYLADEKTVVSELLSLARLPEADREAIRQDAIALVVAARAAKARPASNRSCNSMASRRRRAWC